MQVVRMNVTLNEYMLLLYSVKQLRSKENYIMHQKYFRYLYKTNTSVFTILSTIKKARFQHQVTLFSYATYSSVDAHSSSVRQPKNK